MLSEKRIAELADTKGAKRIAVFNFLTTVGANSSEYEALSNMEMDRNLYKWNAATVKAIRKGISEFYHK